MHKSYVRLGMELLSTEVVLQVVKMGFDRDTLIESLRNRVHNEVTVIFIFAKFDDVYVVDPCIFSKDGFNPDEDAASVMPH
ncbi:SNF1-related protein kinase catalytic subunit alpha KIN10-like protein [Tanacetum coccineum]